MGDRLTDAWLNALVCTVAVVLDAATPSTVKVTVKAPAWVRLDGAAMVSVIAALAACATGPLFVAATVGATLVTVSVLPAVRVSPSA